MLYLSPFSSAWKPGVNDGEQTSSHTTKSIFFAAALATRNNNSIPREIHRHIPHARYTAPGLPLLASVATIASAVPAVCQNPHIAYMRSLGREYATSCATRLAEVNKFVNGAAHSF